MANASVFPQALPAAVAAALFLGIGLGWAGATAAQARSDPAAEAAPPTRACPPVLDQRQPRLQDEAVQDLCQYAGQVVLIVNTASFCGFTSQYRALERLHERYRARGFVVLGFPSNDFSQEPGSNAEIAQLCEGTFGVKFPMFAKSSVTGPDANPVFARLGRTAAGAPRWNFHKYLLGRDGQLIGGYPSAVSPDDARLVAAVEQALGTAR